MSTKALFLDRDGTIIVEKNFIRDPAEVELIPRAPEALKRAVDNGFSLFVVSNQSGVARGLLSEEEVREVNDRVRELFRPAGIEFDGIYYCPHHPQLSGGCECRKPSRGMIDLALQHSSVDLSRSYVIGDRLLDMELARNVGATAVMVLTGYGAEEARYIEEKNKPAYVASDICAAVDWILQHRADERREQ